MKTKSAITLLALALLSGTLAGCNGPASDFDVYDTGTMDADRFAKQTYPVWNVTGPYKQRDMFREDGAVERTAHAVEAHPVPVPEIDGYVGDVDERFTTNSIPMQQTETFYGKLDDAGHWLPEIPLRDVPGQYLRREVSYKSSERPGTIVVDTRSRHLYLIEGNGKAMRYGVGIGRQGYAWKGEGRIQYKKTWPRWTPSENYVADKPEMKMFSASYGGLVGGVNNPLGARALYIFDNGKDTLFRIHGTPDWKSVGKQASSGCIRMFNQDVIDLYGRVKDGAKIVVM